ncbi:GNAT family N-acetyltransferase [Amycolatopsis sp. NPDC051071]|uniref:GNAT family N-acetyltransferase n=1 Tax=Amycolatopsis sp. NPDC051071 TaxID=3154637 RepID=UPI0034343821
MRLIEPPRLLPPTTRVRQSWLDGELADRGADGGETRLLERATANFGQFVAEQQGVLLRWGVPATIFWYVSGPHYLGELVIRHELTPALAEAGGHIGYSIASPWRGKGHGTRMLSAGLAECRRLGLRRVLLTCAVGNAASRRTILANGGVPDGRAKGEDRFWIEVPDGGAPQTAPWPATPPAHGSVVLREFTEADVHLALELGEDPYVPLIGSLPAHPSRQEAEAWIARQRTHHAEGRGFPFVITADGTAVGTIGLWLRKLSEGIGIMGYSVSPEHRRRGFAADALKAITEFAGTVPGVERIELYIEPWNRGSIRAAEKAGYRREGLLPAHQEIGGTARDMLLYVRTLGCSPCSRSSRGT